MSTWSEITRNTVFLEVIETNCSSAIVETRSSQTALCAQTGLCIYIASWCVLHSSTVYLFVLNELLLPWSIPNRLKTKLSRWNIPNGPHAVWCCKFSDSYQFAIPLLVTFPTWRHSTFASFQIWDSVKYHSSKVRLGNSSCDWKLFDWGGGRLLECKNCAFYLSCCSVKLACPCWNYVPCSLLRRSAKFHSLTDKLSLDGTCLVCIWGDAISSRFPGCFCLSRDFFSLPVRCFANTQMG